MAQVFPNEAAQAAVRELVQKAKQSVYESGTNLYKNKVDPFSALIDSMLQEISLSVWINQEKARQKQKTLQNCIGEFHQSLISTFNGWQNLGTGSIVDIINKEAKIIAEVKNKFNTTKGNHKVNIYHDLAEVLKKIEYNGYTGYYVEIIPSGKKSNTSRYNKPFTPSDNKQKKKVISREDIRVIDGRSFYHIVTGQENALDQLYKSFPSMIRNAIGNSSISPENELLFMELFLQAFP